MLQAVRARSVETSARRSERDATRLVAIVSTLRSIAAVVVWSLKTWGPCNEVLGLKQRCLFREHPSQLHNKIKLHYYTSVFF